MQLQAFADSYYAMSFTWAKLGWTKYSYCINIGIDNFGIVLCISENQLCCWYSILTLENCGKMSGTCVNALSTCLFRPLSVFNCGHRLYAYLVLTWSCNSNNVISTVNTLMIAAYFHGVRWNLFQQGSTIPNSCSFRWLTDPTKLKDNGTCKGKKLKAPTPKGWTKTVVYIWLVIEIDLLCIVGWNVSWNTDMVERGADPQPEACLLLVTSKVVPNLDLSQKCNQGTFMLFKYSRPSLIWAVLICCFVK